ncbi:MAG: hypothetical protein EHM80_05335 [Nitrospiraceae bacterium]|nr:MAG: hypothetical protein EHM80_05335 [Nitrospiraceae bacterium]
MRRTRVEATRCPRNSYKPPIGQRASARLRLAGGNDNRRGTYSTTSDARLI